MLIRRVVNVAFGILIAYLSVPVVINLLSPRQMMNTSFEPLRIVNTYGAFGRWSSFTCFFFFLSVSVLNGSELLDYILFVYSVMTSQPNINLLLNLVTLLLILWIQILVTDIF